MSREYFKTGIRLDYGSMKLVYRDARDISVRKDVLTFNTRVRCTGNGVDSSGNLVWKRFSRGVYEGLENCIPNPIYVRYEYVDENTTKVTAYLQYTEGHDVFDVEPKTTTPAAAHV